MKRFSFLFLALGVMMLSACTTNDPDQMDQDESSQASLQGSDTIQIDLGADVPEPETPDEDENTNVTEFMPDFDQTGEPEAGDTIVVMETNQGTIKIRMFPELAPKTVENFVGHANDGYYDGLIFHRVIDAFMIQGGDPSGNGTGGESVWGGKYDDEFSQASNIPGSISMANSGPNTNGSQFFINLVDNSFLDHDKQPLSSKHSVFGQVIEGFDIVEAIGKLETGPMDKPVEDVIMEKVSVETL